MEMMFLIIFLFAGVFEFSSCKARKTAKQTIEVSDKSKLTIDQHSDVTTVDTSNLLSRFNQVKADSSDNQMIIENESGQQQHIHANPDGSIDYTGNARKVLVKTKKKVNQVTNQNTQEKKAVVTHQQQTSKTQQQNNKKGKLAIKTTESKSDIGTTLELIACIGLAGGAIFLGVKYWLSLKKL